MGDAGRATLGLLLGALLAPGALGCARRPEPTEPFESRTEEDEAKAGAEARARPEAPERAGPERPAPADTAEAQKARARLVARVASRRPWGEARWNPRVLEAMRQVPRHLFAPGLPLDEAYEDRPQPIGQGQTMSQPSIVAIMSTALELSGSERVLEIGTGSGYQAAILSRLAREVHSIERLPELGEAARKRLAELGHANVRVKIGDGYEGWPERAPFDRVILTAAPPEIPKALFDQLAEGGVLVAPVGPDGEFQELVRYRKRGGALIREALGPVRFVPMVPESP